MTRKLRSAVAARLRGLGIDFNRRRSSTTDTEYYECPVGKRIFLVRVADHLRRNEANPWTPDFHVTDWKSFRDFSKGMKAAVREFRSSLFQETKR